MTSNRVVKHNATLPWSDPLARSARMLKTSRELAKKADGLRQKSESLRFYSGQLIRDSRKLNRRCGD